MAKPLSPIAEAMAKDPAILAAELTKLQDLSPLVKELTAKVEECLAKIDYYHSVFREMSVAVDQFHAHRHSFEYTTPVGGQHKSVGGQTGAPL